MTTPLLAVEAAAAGNYPGLRFNQRERKILASVKVYVDAAAGAGNILKAQLSTGITYSHRVIAAGTSATPGGSATVSIAVAGALSTDLAFVVLHTAGATPRTILTSAATTNAITVVMSGDPSTDHVLTYELLRAST